MNFSQYLVWSTRQHSACIYSNETFLETFESIQKAQYVYACVYRSVIIGIFVMDFIVASFPFQEVRSNAWRS